MREILFRGKRMDNGERIEGDLLVGGYDYDYAIRDRITREVHAVHNESIVEYTGLTDKNGKKIFEGDILKVYETQEHTQNVSVSYENGQFVVSHYALKVLSDRVLQSEVIGDIHDNPELNCWREKSDVEKK